MYIYLQSNPNLLFIYLFTRLLLTENIQKIPRTYHQQQKPHRENAHTTAIVCTIFPVIPMFDEKDLAGYRPTFTQIYQMNARVCVIDRPAQFLTVSSLSIEYHLDISAHIFAGKSI